MTGPESLSDLEVVIPTLNAAASLPATLAALPPGVSVIVSDGGSTDGTPDLARAAGCRFVSGPCGRGQQLRRGAEAATRPWRLFLHADTVVSPEGWGAIARHIAGPTTPALAASLRLAIDHPAWQARWIERAVALRVRHFGLPYGDQGLLIHRDLYAAIGGYRDLPLMEDVEIMGRLGRDRHTALDGAALTSATRWRRRGWIGQTGLNLTCLALFRLGVPAERIARLYDR
ncbi:MAG: TIGR04283 family arsenosugar biosynthesis glycosyltransferase [Brevundimonas sp.]|uniref:TIGR04283 family arsenosugar biosynthesis glycosyltransferase n=1 Tax=Brevundimonas sp. TaxID=1871086 RepID=UPI00273302CF|nr:TIGR04283 family arsenosugar biosynthesis glycosyltransferase [Brevundimonas sp.]MDP3406232.1 TIGR04283 family arsenosugar biosynthesis glycosyltransferase [Brevundimonas sp.]